MNSELINAAFVIILFVLLFRYFQSYGKKKAAPPMYTREPLEDVVNQVARWINAANNTEILEDYLEYIEVSIRKQYLDYGEQVQIDCEMLIKLINDKINYLNLQDANEYHLIKIRKHLYVAAVKN